MFTKNIINKFLLKSAQLIFVGLFLFVFLPGSVSAQSTVGSNINRYTSAFAGEQGAGFSTPTDPRTVVAKVIEAFLSLLGILFLAYAVYAGYLIMSSGGEEDKIRRGKSTLKTAAIGIFVIFSAYSIMYFVVGSAWFAVKNRPPVYFEAGVGTSNYDYCAQGRGDSISCPPR